MEAKNKKYHTSLFFASIIFIFLISFVSSTSTLVDEIEDVCIPTNSSYYDIWLEDYYSIDLSETIKLHYHDPINGNLLTLPAGYSSLNDYCFEISYYFTSRSTGTPTTDLIRIHSLNLDEECAEDVLVKFYDTDGIDQSFEINVSDDCTYEAPSVSGGAYNTTYYSNLVSSNLESAVEKKKFHYCQRIDFAEPTYITNVTLEVNDVSSYNNEGIVDFYIRDLDTFGSFTDSWNMCYNCGSGDYGVMSTDFGEGSTGVYVDGETDICFRAYNYNNNAALFNAQGSTSDVAPGKFCYWKADSGDPSVSTDFTCDTNKDLYFSLDFAAEDGSPSGSDIASINMTGNTSYTINLASYFGSYEDMYITSPDPLNPNFEYKLYTGYSTLNADYYEFTLHNNGTLRIDSYARPYSLNAEVFACNYTGEVELCSSETFSVYINSALNDVIQHEAFTYYNFLGDDDSLTISGNTYFQYYDDIFFSYIDDNSTGILTDDFNFSWLSTNVSGEYLVKINCTIDSDVTTYNVLGDLNITLECGDLQAYYTFAENGDFGNDVFFRAENSHSFKSDFFYLSSGTPDDFIRDGDDIGSDNSAWEEQVGIWGALFPDVDSVSDEFKFRVFFVVTGVILVSVVMVTIFISVALCLGLSAIVLLIVSLFFASIGYISFTYPIIGVTLLLLFGLFKFLRGGR